ncbi:MAG: hypothetical protein GXC76_10040 [Rhodanobacteraceae bacterium]|jgi:hypothetical protein|nr:hypothetical protein [Rhodanobacteraceae bacterium]
MKKLAIALTAAALAGVSFVAAAARIEGTRDIKRYEQAAGAAVDQMPGGSMVDWQALDDRSLAVWTANDKAWLVRTDEACGNLMHTSSVQLTSRGGVIKSGSDSVEVGDTHCKIASIQPVDYSRLMAMDHRSSMSHHAARKAHKAAKPAKPAPKPEEQQPAK